MARAPFQVIVIPYRYTKDGEREYALFYRRSPSFGDFWQAVAGGGEDDETPLEAARRETHEETGIDPSADFIALDSCATIPAPHAAGMLWGPAVLVIPEYSFGVHARNSEIHLSAEHLSYRWVDYASARQMLLFDSNKNALWELDYRLSKDGMRL
ncbi:MAG: NUDIX pyrophosphatase [Chloroflexota bacterium]